MSWEPRSYVGVRYVDPRDELRARARTAEDFGDAYAAVPVDLIEACLNVKECEERTVVNGDRMAQMLIEVKCTRLVDPITRRHEGMHVNGKTNW